MTRKRHLFGALVLAFLAVLVLSANAQAALTCRGGANDGDPCTTDADCPGACLSNASHPICTVVGDCPRVCRGGDTPGAECPTGACPGVCIGGSNNGNPCTHYDGEECPGGYCNAKCARDRCKLGRCRDNGGHSLSGPRADLDDIDDDAEVETACAN
jgi:hypothetical protein